LMDALRNQIIERKVVAKVVEHATFKDLPYQPSKNDAEAIETSAGGDDEDASIPEAKHADAVQSMATTPNPNPQ
jgi:hypothetical protein